MSHGGARRRKSETEASDGPTSKPATGGGGGESHKEVRRRLVRKTAGPAVASGCLSSARPQVGRPTMPTGARSRSPRGSGYCSELDAFDSVQALYLVREWIWGKKLATQVQREAALALADQIALLKKLQLPQDYAHSSLRRLAAIGAEGKMQGNCARDLVRFLAVTACCYRY